MNIVLIPARCGSKGIHFKNIKKFNGKPLIYWSIMSAQNSKFIDKIFVASDCDEIKSVVNSFGLKKCEVYDRDPNNAQDQSTTESLMIEFINNADLNDDDILLLMQATSPLTETSDVNGAIGLFKQNNADSLLSCTRQKIFLWNSDGTPQNYDYKKRPRRQEYSGVLVENGAIYINTVGSIKENKNRLSGQISIYEMDSYKSVDLDDEHDWIIAENLMQKLVIENT